MSLTEKQRLFAHEYLIDFNATQAATRAGYSKKTAYRSGYLNVKNCQVRALIDELMANRLGSTESLSCRTAEELVSVGLSDISNYVTWGATGVKIKDSVDLSKFETAAVLSIKETVSDKGSTVEVKLHPKLPALTELAKRLGLHAPIKQEIETNGPVTSTLDVAIALRDGLRLHAEKRNEE